MGKNRLVNLVCNQDHDGKFSKPIYLNPSKSVICPDSEVQSLLFGESFLSSRCQIRLYFMLRINAVELILTKLFQKKPEVPEDEKIHRIDFKKTFQARGA